MSGEEKLGTGQMVGSDAEEVAEPFDKRAAAAIAQQVSDVGPGGRAHEAEQDDDKHRVVSRRGPRPGDRRSASPGNGRPALSMRMPRPADGYPSASTIPAELTRLHILDDPMSDYGEHEPTEDPLQQLRHSTAHLLAAAVTELYPEAKYGIGPPVQDGFYYDFDFGGKSISESDLAAIESRMRKLAQADIPFVHEVLSREKAVDEL